MLLKASVVTKSSQTLSSPPRLWHLFIVAALCTGAHAAQLYGDAGDYGYYDNTWSSGMYFTWTSSSGASGSIHYHPGAEGFAVPDEANGGMTRRVVLAPASADCQPFPVATNKHRGQEAGIPYDENVIVMVMAMLARPCSWSKYLEGAKTGVIAGFIWMWSDENDPLTNKEDYIAYPMFGWGTSENSSMPYPNAAIARGAGPVGGLTMATEIFNNHRVDLTWPGTGPLSDQTERAALKDLMRNIDTTGDDFFAWPVGHGFAGTLILPEEFIADDSIDPCSNNGEGKRLYGVTYWWACSQPFVRSVDTPTDLRFSSFHRWVDEAPPHTGRGSGQSGHVYSVPIRPAFKPGLIYMVKTCPQWPSRFPER
jgi:hypothetical protein